MASGKRIYRVGQIFGLTIALVILAIYVTVFVKKRANLEDLASLRKNELKIDMLQLVVFSMFFLTLMGALIFFIVLEKRHQMKIRRLQLTMAACFGASILALNSM